jgi:hypothetical protein
MVRGPESDRWLPETGHYVDLSVSVLLPVFE